MSLLIDSKAQFLSRAAEVGIGQALIDALVRSEINMMSKLAYWVGQPGVPLDEAKYDAAVRAVLGSDPSIGDSAALKRLIFEAQAIAIQSLKNAVEAPGTESSTPKKIPQAEKEARLADLRTRITGILIEGVNEPAVSFFEQTQHQYEQRTIKYLAPEKCPSREFEIVQMKPVKQLIVHGGNVVVGEASSMPDSTVNSSLLVQQAFIRRALAYEFSDLISFSVSQKYIDTLFRHMTREAPAGYRQMSLQQVIQADKAVFAKLAEVGAAIRRDSLGVRPLDRSVVDALHSYEVSFHLFPLAIPEKVKTGEWRESPYWNNQSKRDKGSKGDRREDKGKGKGKRKAKGKRSEHLSTWMPPGLKGGRPVDKDGKAICFNYNLNNCSAAEPGQDCARGRHVCCKCFEVHPFVEAHKSNAPGSRGPTDSHAWRQRRGAR